MESLNKCVICNEEIKQRGIILERLCKAKGAKVCSMKCFNEWEAEHQEVEDEETE